MVLEKLVNQLRDMGFESSDSILIHSSLKKINLDANDIIDTLKYYFKDGLVMLPTHTWTRIDDPNYKYDPETEDSCVGLLTNIFRKEKGVVRSLHPTHSIAGYGIKAKEYLTGAEDDFTPCSPNGAWGRLSSIDAKILLVGCNFTRNTFIHSIEEKANIPNRLSDFLIEFNIKKEGNWIKRKFKKHYHPNIPSVSDNYDKIEEEVINNNIVKIGNFGDAKVMYFSAKELENYLLPRLIENNNYLLK